MVLSLNITQALTPYVTPILTSSRHAALLQLSCGASPIVVPDLIRHLLQVMWCWHGSRVEPGKTGVDGYLFFIFLPRYRAESSRTSPPNSW